MKEFIINDSRMSYLDRGQGSVVVFGHSYLWDSTMWKPQIEILCQSYRCIVPDFWAHGTSDGMPQDMHSLQDYAGHILMLMDHLGVEKFSIVGLSVGGMWGAEIVNLVPDRVTSLVLMDTFVGSEPDSTYNKYFSMLDTITELESIPKEMIEVIVSLFFSKKTLKESVTLVEQFRQKLKAMTGKKAIDIVKIGRIIFARRNLTEEILKFKLPVLIVVGEEDIPRPVLEARIMHNCVRDSELVLIPDAGHISNLEQPELVTKILSRFMEKYVRSLAHC